MQRTRLRSLGLEDTLDKETATHSSILTWKIPWTAEPGSLQSVGSQRVRHDLGTKQQQQMIREAAGALNSTNIHFLGT